MAAPDSGKLCCLRCGKPIGDTPSARPHQRCAPCEAASDRKPINEHPSGYDGWGLDEDLRHMGRLLGVPSQPAGRRSGQASEKKRYRIDAAHGGQRGPHFGRRAADVRPAQVDLGTMLVGAATWTMLTLGLMASACGGVLLIWSAIVQRTDLWNIGLPIAIGGFLALVVAMVLQLDRLSGDNRQTAAQLERFDDRLVQLRRDAAAAESRPVGDAFYTHLADGVSPQLLLTDLKSQLELLTRRLGEPEQETSQQA